MRLAGAASGSIIAGMEKLIGYMVTFTTYGTWLQGDERGYVKDRQVLEGNERLLAANKRAMRQEAVRLTRRQREIVREAILNEAKELKQKVFAICVWSTHVHVVGENIGTTIDRVAGRYKAAATKAMRSTGFEGKVWTKGYDKRFCYDEDAMKKRIAYVERHER